MSTHANGSTMARRTGCALAAACVVLLAGLLTAPAIAQTPTPYQDIASSGPLTHVYLGNELSCQVSHTGDAANEVFPPSAIPGSCGTFVFVNGTLYAPDFNNHSSSVTSSIGPSTPFTVVSQSPVSGAGTTANPYAVTTVVDVGTTGLRITQVDKYVVGQESYRSDITITNNSGAALSGIIYRAADCYLQGSDQGYGFIDAANSAAGCSVNPNNSPPGRIEQWFPITAGANYMEARYSTVWGAIGAHTAFPNSCECTVQQDNGAGISWNFSIAPAGSSTFAHYTTFSPQGVAGPPPANSGTPPAFGPGGVVVAPSNRQCVSRRHFKIKVRSRPGNVVVNAEIFVNGRRVQTFYVKGKLRGQISSLARLLVGEIAAKFGSLKGRRIGANVDLRGLPKGTVFVRIVAITDDGKVIQGKRKYHTCVPKRRGGNPKL